MTSKAFFLTLGAALFSASTAATAPSVLFEVIKVDALNQKASLTYNADLGFPDGVRWVTVDIDCRAKGSNVTTRGLQYSLEGAMAFTDDPLKDMPTDPEAVALFKKAGILLIAPKGDTFIAKGLWMHCRNGILLSDYKMFDRAGSSLNPPHIASNLKARNGPIWNKLTVPILTGESLTISMDGESLNSARTVQGVSLGNFARGTNQAFFYYDAAKKILVPLRYENNDQGALRFKDVPLSANRPNRKMVFYYAPNFRVNTGWMKTTVDLADALIWSEPATRPAGSQFGK